MPSISVVIPLYNKENHIINTINSVLNQSYKNFELIVVNDGSTDNSLEIANKCLTNFENKKIINQKNRGLSGARNTGVYKSEGELVAFLDADDTWHPDFLKHIYDLYINFPEASLYGTNYLEKYDENNILEPKTNLDANLKNKSFIVKDFFEANYFQSIVCQSSFATKKSVFEEVKFDEEINFAEDIDFYIKSNLKFKFAYCYKALSVINLNVPNQITSIGIKDKTLPNFEAFKKDASKNESLKKFIDFIQYTFLIQYKLNKDLSNFNLMFNKIDLNNLTQKQRFLLKSPVNLLKFIKKIKKILLKYNFRVTTF